MPLRLIAHRCVIDRHCRNRHQVHGEAVWQQDSRFKPIFTMTAAIPRALYRLLRALASIGIFAEEQGRFVQTRLSECLLDPSMKALATVRGEFQYRAWEEFLHSVHTGDSAFEQVFGKPLFDYFSDHPETGKLFDQAMTGVHGRETEAMLEAYDFTGIMPRRGEVKSPHGSLIFYGGYPESE